MNTMTDLEKYAQEALTPAPNAYYNYDGLHEYIGSLGTIQHRDSRIIDESNADVIKELLTEKFGSADDTHGTVAHWDIMGMRCWLVGWRDELVVRVLIEEDGPIEESNITAVFRYCCELMDQIKYNYPILDEEDYSQRVYDSTLENIKTEAPYWADVNDESVGDIFSWLFKMGYEAGGDDGDWFNRDEIAEACDALQLIADEEEYNEWKEEQNG